MLPIMLKVVVRKGLVLKLIFDSRLVAILPSRGYQVCFRKFTEIPIFNLTVEKPNLQFLQNQTDIYMLLVQGGSVEQLNTTLLLQNYGIATLPARLF